MKWFMKYSISRVVKYALLILCRPFNRQLQTVIVTKSAVNTEVCCKSYILQNSRIF